MKRIICLILVIVLLSSSVVPVSASDITSIDAKPNYVLGLQSYFETDNSEQLLHNENYAYWLLIEDFDSDIVMWEILNAIDLYIGCGTYPDVHKYTEVLVNLIATYDRDNASDIAEQHKNDNMKSALDYAMDIAKIGADAIDLMTGMNKSASKLEKQLSTAVSGLSTMADNVDNWIDALSDLETIVQNYSSYDMFLSLIEKKSTGDLKTAASSLRRSMEKAMQLKLDSYTDILAENFENYTEFFFNDVFFDALKLSKEYASDEYFKNLVDLGSDFTDKAKKYFLSPGKSWELGIEIGKLVGNIAVNGEDVINRLHELMALRDIGNILCDELNEIESSYSSGSYDHQIAQKYFELSNYLIGCRIRGEYCHYSIIASDTGLCSKFSFKTVNDAEKWYQDKSEKIMAIRNAIEKACNAILVPVETNGYEVGELSEWYIYDVNGSLCHNYTLNITSKEQMHIGAIVSEDFTQPIEYVVTTSEPLLLELDPGYWYAFEIQDNANTENTLYVTVTVNPSSDGLIEMVEIQTDFTANSAADARLPSSIIAYVGGVESEEYHFTYNTLGQVVAMEAYRYEDGNAIKWYTQKYEYDENGNLALKEHGSSQSYYYQYDYDTNGEIKGYSSIEYFEDVTGPSDYYTLFYDNQGRRIKKQNEDNSSVQEYSYDESSKLVCMSSEYDWGDAHFKEVTTYDYSYAPLIINSYSSVSNSEVYGNYSGKSITFMPHWNLTMADWNIDDLCSFETDESGYLLRVLDAYGQNVYVCHYDEIVDEEESSNPSTAISGEHDWAEFYIPKVEQALKTASESGYPSNGIGTLFDLDDDKVPELILSYPWWQGGSSHIPVYAYDIYDYQDNQLICYAEKQTFHAAYVSGSEGYVCVELYKNKPTLMTYYRWGETGAWDGYDNAEYGITVFDNSTFAPIHTLWVDADQYDVVYKIDDITVSEEEFADEVTHYSCISLSEYASAPISFRPTNKYGVDLYDLLCQLQTLVGI